jgi:hypothetical protein
MVSNIADREAIVRGINEVKIFIRIVICFSEYRWIDHLYIGHLFHPMSGRDIPALPSKIIIIYITVECPVIPDCWVISYQVYELHSLQSDKYHTPVLTEN